MGENLVMIVWTLIVILSLLIFLCLPFDWLFVLPLARYVGLSKPAHRQLRGGRHN
jgi:hypothetical protein